MPTPEISQGELAYLQSLMNQRDSLQRELRQLGKALFTRLDKGVHVEPGVHKARIEESDHATYTVRRLVLNQLPMD